jgi:hypothetical protein
VALLLASGAAAHAGRPLVTDDAGVVGAGVVQLESWVRGDHEAVGHWNMLTLGLGDRLEIALGGQVGLREDDEGRTRFGAGGPLLQAKLFLLAPRPRRRPGLALAAGVLCPYGGAGLEATGWEPFAVLAFTESFSAAERLLLHANVGVVRLPPAALARARPTWAGAAEVRVIGPLSGIAELFSGDPYAERPGGHVHGGARLAPTDGLHLDATAGVGLWGRPRSGAWVTVGLRLATE